MVQSVCAICMSADDGYPCSDFKGCKRAKMVVAAFVDFDSCVVAAHQINFSETSLNF